MTFRVTFVVMFLFSMTLLSVYTFSVFRPFFGWLALVFVAVYTSRNWRSELQVGTRRKFWWFPLALAALSLAFTSYSHYLLGHIKSRMVSAILCLISVGCVVYYALKIVKM